MNEDTLFAAKLLLGLVCFLGVCLIGYLAVAAVHSMFSSAQALLQVAGA